METRYLKDIGLSESEIRIYLDLLQQGESLASELSHRTGTNRSLTYSLLDGLIRRGLTSYVIRNNRKCFMASHPEKILSFLQEKEHNIQKILPELNNLKHRDSRQYSVEVYDGAEGLKTVIDDVLRSKPMEFLDMTSGKVVEVLPNYMDYWHAHRIRIIPVTRLIYNRTTIGKKRAKDMAKLPKTEVRLLPEGFSSPSHLYIYGDKVGITLWEKESPFAILITSPEVAKRFTEFFEWFWKIGEHIT